jgi:glycine/D-amino acid oxidase-like deaminating enzyme
VKKIEKKGEVYLLQTEAGTMTARQVVVATSGYTDRATAMAQKRSYPSAVTDATRICSRKN